MNGLNAGDGTPHEGRQHDIHRPIGHDGGRDVLD
jgi:hypothetical protein